MEINKRFFKAFEALSVAGKIDSMTAFCEKYGLYRIKYSRLKAKINEPTKKDTDYKNVDSVALGYLVKDYNVSAEWILTGKGQMFANSQP